MKAATPKKLLAALLLRKGNRSRLWMAWISLCVGTVLLLLSVMIWWNFQQLLYGKKDNDSLGSTFLTVSKKVTDAKMGRPELTQFNAADIEQLKHAPGVQDVGILTSNHFPANVTLNSSLGFSTQVFLESVPDRFMDKQPSDWRWQEGSRDVPIILSSEFLNLYNYGFALSQGLPQLSESSIQSLAFDLTLGAIDVRETYSGHVVGFSDRIASVLVPESFMEFANQKYGRGAVLIPSRLIIKVTDPSDKQFGQFLQKHDYITNSEQLRWNRIRAVVEAIAGSTGLLALILMAISGLVFILFIELTIARAQQSLVLLLQLGYSPDYLRRFMMIRFLPLMLAAILIAVVFAVIAQWLASVYITSMNLELSHFPGWPVWATAAASTAVLFLQVRLAVGKAVKNIS